MWYGSSMSDYFTPQAVEEVSEKLVGKPVTANGRKVGVVTHAESGYDGIYVTLKVDHPRGSKLVAAGVVDFKVDV